MAAARSLGSEGELAFELGELQQRRTNEMLDVMLLDMVCGTFAVGEVVAAKLIRYSIDVLPATPYRDVLRRIASDEVLHSRIGPELLSAWRKQEKLGALPYPGDHRVNESISRAIETMRARDVIDPAEALLFEDAEQRSLLMALGIPPSLEFKQVYLAALDEIRMGET
jgi:hypothetical protein